MDFVLFTQVALYQHDKSLEQGIIGLPLRKTSITFLNAIFHVSSMQTLFTLQHRIFSLLHHLGPLHVGVLTLLALLHLYHLKVTNGLLQPQIISLSGLKQSLLLPLKEFKSLSSSSTISFVTSTSHPPFSQTMEETLKI